ncbi:unnamed protein product [Arctogadus glacialis]
MGVAQLAYEPQLQTITANSQTGICASFKTWFKTVKVPFTSSQAGSVKLRAGAKSQQGHPRPQESNILNLSTIFHLSETETQLLERGLSFIPTPRISDKLKFLRDVHKYNRSLKLMEHFHGRPGGPSLVGEPHRTPPQQYT